MTFYNEDGPFSCCVIRCINYACCVIIYYVILCTLCDILLGSMSYYLSIVPNLMSKSLVSSYRGSTGRFMISYLCFLAISAIRILHSTQHTHLLTLLLAPRHCLYLLRRTPKHTAITFVPPLPKHHLYLNTKLTALTFSNNNMSTRRTFELGYDEVSYSPATPPKSVCGPCAHGRHGSCERVCCQCPH